MVVVSNRGEGVYTDTFFKCAADRPVQITRTRIMGTPAFINLCFIRIEQYHSCEKDKFIIAF